MSDSNMNPPEVVRAISLYCRDPQHNADKEYHIRILQEGPEEFTVEYQHGRRGASMPLKYYERKTTRWRCDDRFNRIVAEKTSWRRGSDQYHEFDFSPLGDAYRCLIESQVAATGVDLYMRCDKKVVSMVDYLAKGGESKRAMQDLSSAYAARAATDRILAEELGMGLPDLATARQALQTVNVILHRGSGQQAYSPADLGVYLGHMADGEVRPGLPQWYLAAVGPDSGLEVEPPEVTSAPSKPRRKKTAP